MSGTPARIGIILGALLLAWLTIDNDVLAAEPEERGEAPVEVSTDYSCAVSGPPWRRAARRAHAALGTAARRAS